MMCATVKSDAQVPIRIFIMFCKHSLLALNPFRYGAESSSICGEQTTAHALAFGSSYVG